MPMNNKKMIARWLHAAWLLPVAWLVGCSTDNGAEPAENPAGLRPLTFTVSTDATEQDVTRGIPQNELDGEFGVFCADYDYASGWGTGQPLSFMKNEMVMGSGSTWTTSEGYFVPSRDKALKFFAYYPYESDVTKKPLVFTDPTEAFSSPGFTYTMPTDAEDQVDLMYAVSDEMRADNQGKLGTVHLQFHHLLTALTISANGNEEGTITKVTLKNLYPTGEFEYSEGVLRANKANATDVVANVNLKVGPGEYKQADDGLSFMLILQPMTEGDNPEPDLNSEAEMEIEFWTPGATQPHVFTSPLSNLATSLTQSKNTLLRLSVQSIKKVKVQAEIINWEHGANFDGAVSDQPQVELEPLIVEWDALSNDRYIKTGPNPYDLTEPKAGDDFTPTPDVAEPSTGNEPETGNEP